MRSAAMPCSPARTVSSHGPYPAARNPVGEKGGEAGSYEDWTVDELRERAAELDIEGRSTMKKDELIEALRNH